MMVNIASIKISKKARIAFVGVLLLIFATIITARVVATSTIKVLWSYKNVDKSYIVCQIEDTEYGISKITNLDGTALFEVELDIDDQTGGQITPLTIKYPLENGETSFKVWNTNDKYKIVKMNEISLNITNASTNEDGSVLSINAINEDGNINQLEYMNGDTIESYNRQEVFSSIQLSQGDTRQIKVTTSNSTYPIIVNLDNDTIPPQKVYVYKNNDGKIALTAQSSSGIWQITDADDNVIEQATQFETYETFLFETTKSSVLVKNGVGKTTEVVLPTESCEDEGVVANVTYTEDAFVINASSGSVQLWKITNSQDDSLIHKFTDEPNSITYSISRESGILGIRVYDMAGNYKTIIFDKTPPLISWVYKNTTENMVVVCVEDTDSGLKYIKDARGNEKCTFSNNEQKAVFEYYIEEGINSLNMYDYENNMSTLNFSDIKFNVTSAYKNIDGDRISIIADINDPTDSTNVISKITYIDGKLIETINAKSLDRSYALEYDGTVKVNLYDKYGDYIVVVLDYEEDDEPEITKCVKSETRDEILVKATDTESGLAKITYTDGRIIKEFPKYTKTVDDVYSVADNTDSILVWDRIGNVSQFDFTNNTLDEAGPELVDDIQYDTNGDDYTITLRDDKVGISKITTSTGAVLYDFKNDGYPPNGTYSGKISTDGSDIKIYDRLGNVTCVSLDKSGPSVISCEPRGRRTTDWRIVAKEDGIGLSKLTYENGNLICDIPDTAAQQTIDFSVTQGTSVVLLLDKMGNSTRVELDNTIPELLDIYETEEDGVFGVIARDRGIGLKSVRSTPNGEDLAVFDGDTRLQETVELEIPDTVEKLYVVDLADNVSEAFELETGGGLGGTIIIDGGTIQETNGGVVINPTDNDGDGIVDVKLYDDTGNDIVINKDDEGNIGPNPGITIQEGSTVRLLLGNEDVYVYGGYVGSGDRQTDANYIHYPGISVPEGAKLIIQNRPEGATGTLYVYGDATTDYGIGDGSAAGIGGYGVVVAAVNEKALAQSSGEIEIVSGNVVSISKTDKNAYGTGAGIGGGGACAWNGLASAGLGNKNNIIIHDEANVVATTNGQKGVGATIGGGGKYDKNNRQGSSGGTTIVDYGELPFITVQHTPTEETHDYVTLKVTVSAKQGLASVTLDDDLEVRTFSNYPITGTCEFKVNENRQYRITATDKDGLSNTERYRIDNISNIIDDDNPTGDNSGNNGGDNSGDNGGNNGNNGNNNGNNGDNSGNNGNNGNNNGNNGDNSGNNGNNGSNNGNNQGQFNPSIMRLSESYENGIRINRDCTIIFDNEQDIIINKQYKTNNNGMAGIHIEDGVNVKILQIGRGNVAIYGGHNKDEISYPGIMVPEHSTLEIQGVTNAKLYAFGYGIVSDEENMIIGGSGAGIGGYGCYNKSQNAKGQDCGSVNIISGNIEAYGGTIELKNGTSQASGAGIGGGGAYSVVGMATSGKVKGTISNKGANVVAIGGISNRARGANIGNGGSATVEGVNINGQRVPMVTDYIEISHDTVIKETSRKGYRITRDCKLTFENTKDIIIGSTRIGTAGISVAEGVQAELAIEGGGNVTIYGGYAGRGNKDDGYFIMYPSIEVPKTSRLTINNKTAQSLTLYGGGIDEIPVSAAVLGTCGVYSSGNSAISNDVGRVIINGGTVNVIPKKVAYYGEVGAVGAAIGSGGAASNNRNAIVSVGKLKDYNVEIADVANVVIRTDKATKIGSGSMLSKNTVIKGEESKYVTIDTLAPEAKIGRIDDGRYPWAQIKVGARDKTSKLSRVELEDGTVYRFPKYHQSLGSVYFKWYKNGPINAKVYDEAGNYRRVSMNVSGLNEQEIGDGLIKIDVDNGLIRNINDGEYVKVSFKAQPKNVNMYVRIDDKEERLVHRGNDDFSYNLQVFDNCVVTARMEDVKTLKTVWEEKREVSNLVRVTTSAILSKTSNSAKVECLLQELYKEDYKACNIAKIGAYYSVVGGNNKVYNVSHGNVLNDGILGDNYLKYNLNLNRLRANTKYKVQTYIVNSLGQEIRSPEVYFRTRPNGGGITTRYYEVASNTPSLIKQSRKDNVTLQWGTLEQVRNKYGDIMIDRVAKGKIECVGQIVPINSRSIWFKIDSNKDALIEIGQEKLNVSKGENYISTKNIYLEGEKYPFRMKLTGDTAGGVDVKVSWLEDGRYQEIVSEQFYPKEYVKIESAIVDKNNELQQEIDKNTGKPINRKVLCDGMQVKKLDIKNTKVVLASGAILKLGISAEVEGNIILKGEGAILPIADNVALIDYENQVLVLSDGSTYKLYKDADVIGNVRDKRTNKVYDLCKYIQDVSGNRITLVDGTSLTLGSDVKSIDGNYVRSLYRNNYETPEYQEVMNKYATTERLVYEMSTSNISDLGVGEARLFEVLPIKILLSFDADENFVIKDPVIEINGNLTDDREGNVGNNLKLGFPGDITKRAYASWRYMNNEKSGCFTEGDMSNYATIDRMKNGNFKVTLNGYSKRYGAMTKDIDNNIMLNLLLQVETPDNVTKEEILQKITRAQNSYTAYTNVRIKEITLEKKQTKMDVIDTVLPIKIKK